MKYEIAEKKWDEIERWFRARDFGKNIYLFKGNWLGFCTSYDSNTYTIGLNSYITTSPKGCIRHESTICFFRRKSVCYESERDEFFRGWPRGYWRELKGELSRFLSNMRDLESTLTSLGFECRTPMREYAHSSMRLRRESYWSLYGHWEVSLQTGAGAYYTQYSCDMQIEDIFNNLTEDALSAFKGESRTAVIMALPPFLREKLIINE